MTRKTRKQEIVENPQEVSEGFVEVNTLMSYIQGDSPSSEEEEERETFQIKNAAYHRRVSS